METPDQTRILSQVIARAWADPLFKEQLKAEPRGTLAEMGLETPERIAIEVVENTMDRIHFVLPSAPHQGKASIADLEAPSVPMHAGSNNLSYCCTTVSNYQCPGCRRNT